MNTRIFVSRVAFVPARRAAIERRDTRLSHTHTAPPPPRALERIASKEPRQASWSHAVSHRILFYFRTHPPDAFSEGGGCQRCKPEASCSRSNPVLSRRGCIILRGFYGRKSPCGDGEAVRSEPRTYVIFGAFVGK